MLVDLGSFHRRLGELSGTSMESRLDSVASLPYCPTIDERVPTALLRPGDVRGERLEYPMERRKYRRINVTWPISIVLGEEIIDGETINITIDGVLISCGEPLKLNEVFRISIIPPNHKGIEVNGKVIWSDHYAIDEQDVTFGMGICFVKISDVDHHFLKDLVSAHSKE